MPRWTKTSAAVTRPRRTDTGHVSSDQWWAIGHPERVTDYLYRAKHVTTVAAKAIIAAHYGQATDSFPFQFVLERRPSGAD